MLGTLSLALPFATKYPRQLAAIKRTALGRILNDFNWFWRSHMALFVVFYAALICHPWPGLPSVHGFPLHGYCWVRG